MKQLRNLFLLLSGIVLLTLAAPQAVSADVNDFTINDFTADYVLTTKDPQGSLEISENIALTFTDQNHGILRAIPQNYNGNDLDLKITAVLRDGATEKYTTYGSNGNTVLQIGDADTTITGPHNYDIKYTVDNVIRFAEGHDELDWNTNGTGWNQPFEHITARLTVPDELVDKLSGTVCYTGAQGSKATDCTTSSDGRMTTFSTTRTLNAGENMTFVGNFPVGTFHKPTAADWWRDHIATILQLVVPPVVAFMLAYRHWNKYGKDTKGRGTVVPEFGPPDDLRAAEADVINTYKLGTNAVSATIIDLAIRKYLRIVEGQSQGFLGLGKHKTYVFERLAAPVVGPTGKTLKPYESKILEGLFTKGDSVEVEALKSSFYKTAKEIQADLPADLTTAGYFPKNPAKVGYAMIITAVVMFVLGWLVFGFDWPLAVGLILSAIIVGLFSIFMPQRTLKGVEAKDKLAGLKVYMNTAEKDRIAMLQSPDAPYANRPAVTAETPRQTVELFEKLLPFAMVMGVEKEWAKQFENIYTTPPDWYSGNWTAFNTGVLVGSLGNSMSAMNTSFSPPSSSGSGSGGGFSGGGGGGGGGGGW